MKYHNIRMALFAFTVLAAGVASRSLVLVRDSLLAELQARLQPVEQMVFGVSEANRRSLASLILETLL